MGIRFKVWQDEHGTDGKVRWVKYTDLYWETLLESVSVTTDAKIMVVEELTDPYIMPQGCEKRTARISGVFENSLEFNASLDPTLDVIGKYPNSLTEPGIMHSRAISVLEGTDLVPELGTSKWRIISFIWDRQANKLGQYHFTMELGYIWEVENEIHLFADDVGTIRNNDVKFYVMKADHRYNFGTFKYYIYDVTVRTTCQELNTAKFSSMVSFTEEDIIKIYCSTYSDKPVFYGLVKEVKQAQNGTFVINCIEIGELLYRKQCAKVGAGLFKTRIKIPNPYKISTYLTIEQITKLIMTFYHTGKIKNYDPGWGVCTSADVGASQYLPGKDIYLPPQMLSGMSVGKALDTFIINQCGMNIWYDSASGRMEYGFVRNAISLDSKKEFIESTEKMNSSTHDFKADYVVLWNNTSTQRKTYPPDPAVTDTGIQYKIGSDLLDQALEAFAERIYRDMQQSRDMYRVRFQAGTARFQDGDFFTGLGDETTKHPMPYRTGSDSNPTEDPGDSVWQIKEMIITDKYTEVIVGSSYFSVFDLYKDALKRIDGVPTPTEEKEQESYETAIGKSGETINETE